MSRKGGSHALYDYDYDDYYDDDDFYHEIDYGEQYDIPVTQTLEPPKPQTTSLADLVFSPVSMKQPKQQKLDKAPKKVVKSKELLPSSPPRFPDPLPPAVASSDEQEKNLLSSFKGEGRRSEGLLNGGLKCSDSYSNI